MKKKFIIAALLAGIVAVTCLTGYTCKGNGEEEKEQQQSEKGEEVTAEGWTAAINASRNLQNYSWYGKNNETTTVTGKYKGNEEIPVNLVSKFQVESYSCMDLNNYINCNNSSQTESVSGFADLYALDYVPEQLILELPYDFREHKDKNESLSYNGYTVKIDEKVYSASNYAKEWQVREVQETGDTVVSILDVSVATEKNGEEKPVCERYSDFVYSDGVYTAGFWVDEGLYTFSVSFKDGYILSMGFKVPYTEEEDGLTISYEIEYVIQIYDIGKTTATPSPEAVKAVEDYIKENS